MSKKQIIEGKKVFFKEKYKEIKLKRTKGNRPCTEETSLRAIKYQKAQKNIHLPNNGITRKQELQGPNPMIPDGR